MLSCFLFFFFFSSRRRHTRLTCDWSSDVCSSDLVVKLSCVQVVLTARSIVDVSCHVSMRLERPLSQPLALPWMKDQILRLPEASVNVVWVCDESDVSPDGCE